MYLFSENMPTNYLFNPFISCGKLAFLVHLFANSTIFLSLIFLVFIRLSDVLTKLFLH